MATLVPIGEFSRMSYLSVRTLRRYHESGLLEPAQVDPETGYRYYRADQLPSAQVIRRLRALDMPLDEVSRVLAAPDVDARDALISAHLQRMERSLDRTRSAVASLRRLLGGPSAAPQVRFETAEPIRVLAISGERALDDVAGWFAEAFAELQAAAGADASSKPLGALYFPDFFEAEVGRLSIFVPSDAPAPASGRVQPLRLPAAELAVAVHDGPLDDLDRTYAALGTFVSERAIGVDGPIRERFFGLSLESQGCERVEVGWPIFRTAA